MSVAHYRQFTRDDGTVLEVDCIVRCEGRGHGWYAEDYEAWRLADADSADAPLVELTEAEFERLNEEICADSASIEDGYS